jgi:hypothetical protein
MEKMLETLDVAIPCGRTLRISHARGMKLRVIAGNGWVTEEGNVTDYALGAGGERRIGTDGLTLVHAFDAARITIEAPAHASSLTVALGGGYREYASAIWRQQLAAVASRAMRALRYSLASASRAVARSA